MFLERLEVNDFRPYKSAELRLPSSGLVLLVGANNAGKSALLSAFDVVAGQAPPAAPRRVGAETSAHVTAEFRLTDADRIRVAQASPHGDDLVEAGAFRTLELVFRDRPQGGMPAFEARTQLGPEQPFEMFGVETVDEAGNGVARAGNWDWVFSVQPTALHEVEEIPSTQQSGSVHGAAESPGTLRGFHDLLVEWRSDLFHFHAIRSGTTAERPLSAAPRLSPQGENLPEVLLWLHTNNREAWSQLTAAVAGIAPELGELTPQIGANSTIRVIFRDPFTGAEHNLKNLGTGIEQLLLTACAGVTQPPGSITIVEEPETSLHPAAQRDLSGFLRRWARDRVVVVSTHSPLLLDEASGTSDVWLVERSEGVSRVRTVTPTITDALAALGVRLSDVLSADRLLMVEGPSDVAVVRAWFSVLLDETHTAVIASGGGDRAWDSPLLERAFQTADQLDRPMLFLKDRDEMTEDSIAKLTEMGGVHVLARRELENYLLDEEALNAAAPGSNEPVTLEELHRAADEQRERVLAKRVVAAFAVVRLFPRREVDALGTHPSRDGLIELARRQLPDADDVTRRIAEVWDSETERLARDWDERRLVLAPGEEILVRLWTARGGAFDKSRDGPAIAAAMGSPPTELEDAVKNFVDRAS